MFVGYARASTAEQTLDLQLDVLRELGCEKIFTDTPSEAEAERNGLEEALAYVRDGDTLVVWKLDRLGRSIKGLVEQTSVLQAKNIGLKSVTENIDTTTSGMLVFHIFGALADFERGLIRERAQVGLVTARARGKRGGRPKVLTPMKVEIAQKLYADGRNSIDEICSTLNISRATLFRYVKRPSKKQGN
jgi:DNA invertase Pin-like site-specific DNA recombinase